MEEIWKDIEGYEGLYQISSLGRVKGLSREVPAKDNRKPRVVKEQILKTLTNKKLRYEIVYVSKESKNKVLYIHSLMAKHFIPNPDNKREVNHINGIRNDNRLENLEWTSGRENMTHFRTKIFKGSKKSKYHGVYKTSKKKRKGWYSTLCVDGNKIYLGSFLTEEEAHLAYQNAFRERGLQNKYAA